MVGGGAGGGGGSAGGSAGAGGGRNPIRPDRTDPTEIHRAALASAKFFSVAARRDPLANGPDFLLHHRLLDDR